MKGRFLFLGTGNSLGIPIVGCECLVCSSSSCYDKRLRASALVSIKGKQLLIDPGPDFREQALKYHLRHLDFVLITHPHFDHIGGLDDLRPLYFSKNKAVTCLLSKETFKELSQQYYYLIKSPKKPSIIEFIELENNFGSFNLNGILVNYMSYFQLEMKVTGYRFGNLAYISDIRTYSEELLESLKGVDILILGAARHRFSKMHFNIDEAIAFSIKIGAKRTFLTHISHDVQYNKTNEQLPSGIELSYDGLEVEFDL